MHSTSTFLACPIPTAAPRAPPSTANCSTLPWYPERTCMRVKLALPGMRSQDKLNQEFCLKSKKKEQETERPL